MTQIGPERTADGGTQCLVLLKAGERRSAYISPAMIRLSSALSGKMF